MLSHTLFGLDAREWIVRALLLAAALVQGAPIVGLAGEGALRRLYGVRVRDAVELALLRHRAVLLALIAVVLVAAAVRPAVRPLALAVALTSKLAFLWIYAADRAGLQPLRAIARADLVSASMLLVATWLSRAAFAR